MPLLWPAHDVHLSAPGSVPGVVKMTENEERSGFAFLQRAHYCSAPPVFITRRCRGVKDELIWGPGGSLIDSWSDPAPVVQYHPHQWMSPWRKWIASSISLSLFKWKREICSLAIYFFSEQHSKVDLNSTFWGVNCCVWTCVIILHLACTWIWVRWNDLDLVRLQTCLEWMR